MTGTLGSIVKGGNAETMVSSSIRAPRRTGTNIPMAAPEAWAPTEVPNIPLGFHTLVSKGVIPLTEEEMIKLLSIISPNIAKRLVHFWTGRSDLNRKESPESPLKHWVIRDFH